MRTGALAAVSLLVACTVSVETEDADQRAYEEKYGKGYSPGTIEEFCEAYVLKTDCKGIDTVEDCLDEYDIAPIPAECLDEARESWRCWLDHVEGTACATDQCGAQVSAAGECLQAHQGEGGMPPG